MKNIQVIENSDNSQYAIYAVTDEEFAQIFPAEGQNVEFIEDMLRTLGKSPTVELLLEVWDRRVEKPDAAGIHGTLFFGLLKKKKYYPSKNDREMVT
jgi:hypothetical protein